MKKTRTVNTYADLWHGSCVLLDRAEAEAKGSSWVLMSSLLLTAFTFEAYLNHIGRTLFTSWDTLEFLPPMGKLDVVSERLGVSFSPAERPRQTVEHLFRFRNLLAHGKTVSINDPDTLRNANKYLDKFLGQRPLTVWEKLLLTSTHAKRAREDVEVIIRKIHQTARPKNDPVFFRGVAHHSARPEPDS